MRILGSLRAKKPHPSNGVKDLKKAAASLGKDVTKIRLNVLIAGGTICSLAGAMYAFYTSGVAPSALGRFDWTFLRQGIRPGAAAI